MTKQKIRVSLVGENAHTAYVALPGYPDEVTYGVVKKTIRLHNLIEPYAGPDVNLDFDAEGCLIGIEILVYPSEDD